MTTASPSDGVASPRRNKSFAPLRKGLVGTLYDAASSSLRTVINAARRVSRHQRSRRTSRDHGGATTHAATTTSFDGIAPPRRTTGFTALLERLVGALCTRRRKGLSSLQKGLFGVLAAFFAIQPVFWFLETKVGVPQPIASTILVLLVVGLFVTALALPWVPLPGQGDRTRAERLGATIIVWVFIALAPRFIWELPWLFFYEQIKQGVLNQSLWTYMWSPILLGGDARYLDGDPLIVTLEWIAVFVGAFELYAIVQFFRNGKRFTTNQLGLIMSGMVVEVTLPAVYFGVEIANRLESMSSPAEMWVKFVLLNLLWCTMPILTFVWGLRRIATQDLTVTF